MGLRASTGFPWWLAVGVFHCVAQPWRRDSRNAAGLVPCIPQEVSTLQKQTETEEFQLNSSSTSRFCGGGEDPLVTFGISHQRREESHFSVFHRFMQLAPQYYFSNLPPSESKDILHQVMDHLSPMSTMKKEQNMCEKCPETAEQRCALQ